MEPELVEGRERERIRRALQRARQARRDRDRVEWRTRLGSEQRAGEPAVRGAFHARRTQLEIILCVEVRAGGIG